MRDETYLSALAKATELEEIAKILNTFIAQEVSSYFYEDEICDLDEIEKLLQEYY